MAVVKHEQEYMEVRERIHRMSKCYSIVHVTVVYCARNELSDYSMIRSFFLFGLV